jgi:hypothetical protein
VRLGLPLAAALLVTACTASVPPPPVTASAPVVGATLPACPDIESVPTVRTKQPTASPQRMPGPLPNGHPPGTSVFLRGSGIALHENGRLTQMDLPYPLHARLAALAEDGSRVSAYLWDAAGQRPYVWSRDLRSGRSSLNVAQLPFVRAEDLVSWSPDARHLLVSPGYGDGSAHGELYQLALDGTADRRGVLGERVHAYDSRGADEITLVTSPKPVGTTPLGRATLWSWARGAGLVKLLDAELFWPQTSWSPDGTRLALVGLDSNGRLPVVQVADLAAGGTAVSPRTLMRIADLVVRPEGCPYDRGDVGLSRPHWSPDGQSLAITGRVLPQSNYFVAIVSGEGGLRSIFRSPSSCYIPFAPWSARELFIPLFGPDCGPDTLTNRVAVVRSDGAVLREIAIPRKGNAHPSRDGRWFVSVGDGETSYIPVADPDARIVVPLDGFVSWCCADR